MTIVLLSVLVLLYSVSIYVACRNCRDFLYFQKRYRHLLLSAFYTLCLFVCVSRIVQYLYLVLIYLLKKQQAIETFIIVDMVSNSAVICIGIVLVLQIIQLMHGV